MKTLILPFLIALPLFAQSKPAQRFETIARTENAFSLTVTSTVPATFRNYYSLFPIETSPDLIRWSAWMTLLRTNNSTNLLVISDVLTSSVPKRFYRTPTNSLITPLQKPGGSYPVGTTTRLFTDPSRSNRYNIKTNSSFVAQFWYPASATAGALPASYIESAIAKAVSDNYTQFGLAVNVTLFSTAVSHALANVPLAQGGPFPVIIFCHGYACVRTMDADIMAHLASQGYIAIAADHYDAWVSLFPEGLIVRGNAPSLPLTAAQDSLGIQSRTRDVRFMLDQFSLLNSSDTILAGAFDLTHIGILGHSYGGATVADACAADARIKAGLTLDGGGHTNLLGLQITQPFLIASGDNSDGNSIMPPYRAAYRSLFDQLTHDAYWFRLAGSEHFVFVDEPWFLSAPDPRKTRMALTLRAYVGSFFNKYLKGADDHLLDQPSNDYPDVSGYLRK